MFRSLYKARGVWTPLSLSLAGDLNIIWFRTYLLRSVSCQGCLTRTQKNKKTDFWKMSTVMPVSCYPFFYPFIKLSRLVMPVWIFVPYLGILTWIEFESRYQGRKLAITPRILKFIYMCSLYLYSPFFRQTWTWTSGSSSSILSHFIQSGSHASRGSSPCRNVTEVTATLAKCRIYLS